MSVVVLRRITASATNLHMDGFTVNAQGQLSVQYTINGSSATQFSIGIYSSTSSTGLASPTLLQTVEVNDPAQLAGSTTGITYTDAFDAALAQWTQGDFLFAKLDANNQVYETIKADNLGGPLHGAFQNDDGNVFALATGSNQSVQVGQNTASGDEIVTVAGIAQPFQNVGEIYVHAPGSGDTISVGSGVTVPVWGFNAPGSPAGDPVVNLSPDLPQIAVTSGNGPSNTTITSEKNGPTAYFVVGLPNGDTYSQAITVYCDMNIVSVPRNTSCVL